MKCKQCGWKNPDNIDRCEKCGHVIIRPRIDQNPTPDYNQQRTGTDRTMDPYGGNYTSEYQRPYAGETYNGQAYNPQPYNAQPYNAQPYNEQAYNEQAYNGQPYGGQAYNEQPYSGQPYSEQPYNARPYNNQPYAGNQAFNNGMQPSYPEVQPSQPQQPFNQAYGQQQYEKYPLENQYGGTREPQAATQPEAHADERYCPECDAELPAGATECPVCHMKIETEVIVMVEGVCQDCGAEIAPTQKFCHNCGAPLKPRAQNAPEAVQPIQPVAQDEEAQDAAEADEEKPIVAAAGLSVGLDAEEDDDTVAAGPLSAQIPECELRMIDASGEKISTVSCAGAEVELYRGNTDPANNTIARDLQAKLTFADGKWSIEDCSALQTTYIRPSRKMELRDGDVIVMGNREFIFKS